MDPGMVFTQEFIKADRGGRIYVDTGRNGYSATFAAAYAVRPKPGAPISAPCGWEEVERGAAGPRTFEGRRLGTFAPRHVGGQDQRRDLAGRALGRSDRLGRVACDVLGALRRAHPLREVARDGFDVYIGDEKVGQVTSGSPAPFLKKNIGMAFLPIDFANIGQELRIDVRGKRLRAQVVQMPFYKRPK